MLVIDSSAWVEWLLVTPLGLKVDGILAGRSAHAPELALIEVPSALLGLSRGQRFAHDVINSALEDAFQLPATIHRHRDYLERLWQLRHNLTLYDGLYVALAEGLGCPLVTCDATLAKGAAGATTAEIIVVS